MLKSYAAPSFFVVLLIGAMLGVYSCSKGKSVDQTAPQVVPVEQAPSSPVESLKK